MTNDNRQVFRIAKDDTADVGEEFDLEWLDAEGEVAGSETFTAYPGKIPGACLMDIPNMAIDENTVAMWQVFRCALRDDFERFSEIVHDPDKIVPPETLGAIQGWLFVQATGRPTRPSSSSNGRRKSIGA